MSQADFDGLWPDLASGFPHAPDRQLGTIEGPLARLHVFRNRLAHHQRVWSHAPDERYEDLLALAGYIDPALPGWIAATSRSPADAQRQTVTVRPPSEAHPRIRCKSVPMDAGGRRLNRKARVEALRQALVEGR
jgi:hypothetical protein